MKVLLVITGSADHEIEVYLEDGGHAYCYNPDDTYLRTQYYQSRITMEGLNDEDYGFISQLGEGKSYMNDWNGEREGYPHKKIGDNEVVWDMVHWLYAPSDNSEFEFILHDNTKDLTQTLKEFIKFE